MKTLEDMIRELAAAAAQEARRQAWYTEMRERLREVLPEALKRREGLILTIWEKEPRWELESSPFGVVGKLYILWPDRMAPIENPTISFDIPGPSARFQTNYYPRITEPARGIKITGSVL